MRIAANSPSRASRVGLSVVCITMHVCGGSDQPWMQQSAKLHHTLYHVAACCTSCCSVGLMCGVATCLLWRMHTARRAWPLCSIGWPCAGWQPQAQTMSCWTPGRRHSLGIHAHYRSVWTTGGEHTGLRIGGWQQSRVGRGNSSVSGASSNFSRSLRGNCACPKVQAPGWAHSKP